MNKLFAIENMGFKITWKLIYIGLSENSNNSVMLTYDEIFDYFTEKLTFYKHCEKEIVSLLCEKGENEKVHHLLQEFSNNELSDIHLQRRKWRAFILKNTLDNLSEDCFQGLLQLIEFWVSMGLPHDCPQDFPQPNNELSISNYFTHSTYSAQIEINKLWLENEINIIISQENNTAN